MMVGAAGAGPAGLTSAVCYQLAQDIIARGALYATFTTVTSSLSRTVPSVKVCGGQEPAKDNLLKGARTPASPKCNQGEKIRADSEDFDEAAYDGEDGVEMQDMNDGLVLVEVDKEKYETAKKNSNGVLSDTVEVAGTAYTIQRLALAPWSVKSAIGNSLVEIGLLLRRAGFHNLYIPSYVKAHHIRMARNLVPLGYGAADVEIGSLVAQGLMSLGAIGVAGAVGTAAVAEYVVPVVCADNKKSETQISLREVRPVEKIRADSIGSEEGVLFIFFLKKSKSL